jgi:hypothetical protein
VLGIVIEWGLKDMNNAFARKLVADELRETLAFCGLIEEWHCKTKEVDKSGKTFYTLDMSKLGKIKVYSPKFILINDVKVTSLREAKQYIGRTYI